MDLTAADPDFVALWAAVEAGLADAAPKLVLADYLQERGADPDAERGLRWWAKSSWTPASPAERKGLGDWHLHGPKNDYAGLPWQVQRYMCYEDGRETTPRRCGCCGRTLEVLIRRLGRALKARGGE